MYTSIQKLDFRVAQTITLVKVFTFRSLEGKMDRDPKLFLGMDLFEPLSREEIERFTGATPARSYEPGQHIYTPAYRAGIFFLLLRGRVRVYRTEGRHEIILAVVNAGEMFGEAAFTDRRRKGAWASALEPSEVALVGRKTFDRLLIKEPRVGLKAMEILSERLGLYEDRIAALSVKQVIPRLADLILDLIHSEGIVTDEGYKIPTRYTHEQLGSMIGTKRVAVTRALTGLRESGALELRRRQIHVKDMRTLERIAA